MDTQVLYIFGTAVLGLIVLAVFYLASRHGSLADRTPAFLITGPVGSGKTVLFEVLTSGKLPLGTVTSQVPNEKEDYKLPSEPSVGSFKLVDYPGHPKLLQLYLYSALKDVAFLHRCKGILFMVDSANFDKDYCELVAKQMFEIFKFTESVQNGVDMAVCCNRCDLFTSKKPAKIRAMLEEAIEQHRQLEMHNLEKVDTTGDNDFAMQKFSFASLEGNVDFCEGNVFKGKTSLWQNWIDERGVN